MCSYNLKLPDSCELASAYYSILQIIVRLLTLYIKANRN